MPRALDWKYPDLHADLLDWSPLQTGTDTPEDVARLGYLIVAVRDTAAGRYVVAIRDGWYWLIRHAHPGAFDGSHLTEIARTGIRYAGDDDSVIDPAK